MEHYCLQLLSVKEEKAGALLPSAIALELREQYQEVMVDEYQDINDLQEVILHLVSRQGTQKPNLFMVGDVKQSIYRFRLANPLLFLKKLNSFRPEKKAGTGRSFWLPIFAAGNSAGRSKLSFRRR